MKLSYNFEQYLLKLIKKTRKTSFLENDIFNYTKRDLLITQCQTICAKVFALIWILVHNSSYLEQTMGETFKNISYRTEPQ